MTDLRRVAPLPLLVLAAFALVALFALSPGGTASGQTDQPPTVSLGAAISADDFPADPVTVARAARSICYVTRPTPTPPSDP